MRELILPTAATWNDEYQFLVRLKHHGIKARHRYSDDGKRSIFTLESQADLTAARFLL